MDIASYKARLAVVAVGVCLSVSACAGGTSDKEKDKKEKKESTSSAGTPSSRGSSWFSFFSGSRATQSVGASRGAGLGSTAHGFSSSVGG